MPSFNKVILLGNLTRDPEFRSLSNGSVVAHFTLAINRTFTSKDGEKRDETTFVDIDAFGKQADTINKYCKKGSGLLVEGRLRLDKWEDKNTGSPRSKLSVALESFTFVGSRGDGSEAQDSGEATTNYVPPTRTSYSRPTPPPADDKPSSTNMDDQDVPF